MRESVCDRGRDRERERERDRDRDTEREIEKQRHREREREKHKATERQPYSEICGGEHKPSAARTDASTCLPF